MTFPEALQKLAERMKTDIEFAQSVYAALCNVDWQPIGGKHKPECMLVKGVLPEQVEERVKVATIGRDKKLVYKPPEPWCNCGLAYSYSWRAAGGEVADLRDKGESYLDFYCSGGEGHVKDVVRVALEELGWEPVPESGGNPNIHFVQVN